MGIPLWTDWEAFMSRMISARATLLLGLVLLLPVSRLRADDKPKDADYWVEPMKKVHDRFKGDKGTFAHFGDSITVSMAFWSPLAGEPKKMSKEMAKSHALVKKYLKPDCWNKWKGADYGNEGSMTIRWADENVAKWLKKLNPEVILLMFGTNDLGQLELKEYEEKSRSVIERCLKNGSIVILSTIPPRSGRLEQSRKFAAAARKIARDLKVPLLDYFDEILKRRPDDWDGSMAKFKDAPGSEYDVPTLIARDGVHPSNPAKFKDYSEESLKKNGNALRSYLTLMTYADVVRKVLEP
jgi:lysophospholipase L1-like esterase